MPSFKPSPGLLVLEQEIYDMIAAACRRSDMATAEKLFKVWIKLPSDKPNPMQVWLDLVADH